MTDSALEVPESECCVCTGGEWIVCDARPPFSWCLHHLRQATFILEQKGLEPAIRDQAPDGKEE